MKMEKNQTFDEEQFSLRLYQLRESKGISARDMSLRLGQNKNYINHIESKKAYPSMTGFFYICDFLGISPKDFFDLHFRNPQNPDPFRLLFQQMKPNMAEHVYQIAKELGKI